MYLNAGACSVALQSACSEDTWSARYLLPTTLLINADWKREPVDVPSEVTFCSTPIGNGGVGGRSMSGNSPPSSRNTPLSLQFSVQHPMNNTASLSPFVCVDDWCRWTPLFQLQEAKGILRRDCNSSWVLDLTGSTVRCSRAGCPQEVSQISRCVALWQIEKARLGHHLVISIVRIWCLVRAVVVHRP